MHVVHGRAIVLTGEDKHLLNEGDVLVIPSGVPHQFVDVTAPFFYFVTKVQS
jgi:quercetin dioxygenase-like cupin family protein